MAAVLKEFPFTWLRFYREEAGLTQAELADEVGKTKVSINHFERGRRHPSAPTAERIAQELDERLDMEVTLAALFPANGMYEPKQLMRMYVRTVRKREGRPVKKKRKRSSR